MAVEKELSPAREWKGSMSEGVTRNPFGDCITDPETFAKLWKAWKVEGDLPKVDFTRNLVVTATSAGSVLNLKLSLDDKGGLTVSSMASRDFRPGFRFILAVVPNDGVKTVNGKEFKVR